MTTSDWQITRQTVTPEWLDQSHNVIVSPTVMDLRSRGSVGSIPLIHVRRSNQV